MNNKKHSILCRCNGTNKVEVIVWGQLDCRGPVVEQASIRTVECTRDQAEYVEMMNRINSRCIPSDLDDWDF